MMNARPLKVPTTLGGLTATDGLSGREGSGTVAPTRHAAPPPPRWAQRAAALAVLTTVPSGLWRMAMAVGIPVGANDQFRHERYSFPGWGTVYVFGLTFLLVGLALLTLGLVQRWGEGL